MPENRLNYVPPEGQPPNVLTDPRTIAFVTALLTPLFIKWGWDVSMQSTAVWLLTGAVSSAVYAFGQWLSRRRQSVVNSTLNAVANTQPGHAADVTLPSGDTRRVYVPPTPPANPSGIVGGNLSPYNPNDKPKP